MIETQRELEDQFERALARKVDLKAGTTHFLTQAVIANYSPTHSHSKQPFWIAMDSIMGWRSHALIQLT